MANWNRQTGTDGLTVKILSQRDPLDRKLPMQPTCGQALLFQLRGWAMRMKRGNFKAVPVARIYRKRIRHAVDSSDNDQQKYQTCEIFELHSAIKEQKTLP